MARKYLELVKQAFRPAGLKNITKADVLLICHDANRGYTWNELKYSQLLDSINELLIKKNISTITIAKPYSKYHGASAYGNVISVNGLFSRHALKKIIKKCLYGKYIQHEKSDILLWINILKKIQPKIIIGIQPSIDNCIAAKELSIPVCDLQHGLITGRGYYSQEFRQAVGQLGWPDCVLCWDSKSASVIKNEIGDKTYARIIGNPWFLRFIYPEPEDKLVQSAISETVQHYKKPVILVTLQWGLERFGGIHDTGMPEGLVDYIKSSGNDYTWLIRGHPVELQDDCKRENLFNILSAEFKNCKNVLWESCSKYPLPLLLSCVDLHLTSHSAVTIEASWFGINTALLNPDKNLLQKCFSSQIESGVASIVKSNISDINEWIVQNLHVRRESGCFNMRNDSLHLFINEIQEMIMCDLDYQYGPEDSGVISKNYNHG